MENENIEVINDFIQTYKPKGVDILELDIKPTSGRFEYYINPHYIIDYENEEGSNLMNIIWNDENKTGWHTSGEIVFNNFEKEMVKLIHRYFEINIYFRGRSITEKKYWLFQKRIK